MTKIKTIPANIGEYLAYDETSKTGLRRIKLLENSKTVSIGDEAGCLNKTSGYYGTRFNRTRYRNHRIIFFLHHGYCPEYIDHRDGNKQNNKINNLREATISQNNQNVKIRKDNSSGVKGLSSLTNKSGNEYWVCYVIKKPNKRKQKYFRKDLPNSRQLAEQWLVDNREELHGEFTNHG